MYFYYNTIQLVNQLQLNSLCVLFFLRWGVGEINLDVNNRKPQNKNYFFEALMS